MTWLDYILQAARGLQYACWMSSTDIKPSNLMVDTRYGQI
jgi:hypothetical protein